MKTTAVKIQKRHKEVVERACLELGVPVEFFTIEKNEELMQMFIHEDEPSLLFLYGKYVGQKIGDAIINGVL